MEHVNDEPVGGSGGRWWDGCDLVANASILFPDFPFHIRPEIVRMDGFRRMESWWPFAASVATAAERASFLDSLQRHEVGLLALNAAGGNMAAGERGLAATRGREAEFRASIVDVVAMLEAAGGDRCNVLVGNDPAGASSDDLAAMERAGVANLAWAAQYAADHGVTLLVEVLNDVDNPGYAVRSLDAGLRWIDRVHAAGGTSARLLFDVYHLAMLGADLAESAHRSAGLIGHVQVADSPGRGAPGSGSIDFGAALAAITRAGYRGPVALEYRHVGPGAFDWME